MGLGWDFEQAGGSIVPGGSYLTKGSEIKPCKRIVLNRIIGLCGMNINDTKCK